MHLLSAIAALSSLVFGWDVDNLGSRDFWTRQRADCRLSAAGWWAYPAMWSGLQSKDAEVASRCEVLVEKLEGPIAALAQVEGMAKAYIPIPDDTHPAVLKSVCKRINQLGGWTGTDCWWWASVGTHQRGTVAGDCEFVAKYAATHRVMQHLFPPLVPVGGK